MVSSKLVKLSSPVARSCLVAISVALLIDAILTICAAVQYPYLTDYYIDDLYITSSRTIPVVYSAIAIAGILISASTAVACYKNATNYVLIHAGITGVFLPVSILVYFTTLSSRYKASDYIDDYKQMITDYRISSGLVRKEQQSNDNHINTDQESFKPSLGSKTKLNSFINLIDSIQTKFSCCGLDSAHDWVKLKQNYIAPTCCRDPSVTTNPQWAAMFNIQEPDHEFKHCTESNSYQLGCVVALKEDELSKHAWLGDLIVFMIVITIANTIVSLLLFGLSKTEDSFYEGSELSIIGASATPGPHLPTITSIKHRPSIVHNLGTNTDTVAARAQAVRFNISHSPRTSISGPSKFSAAARRGSSFI